MTLVGGLGRVVVRGLRERADALRAAGWEGREAEWITLVCLHSGVFLRSQLVVFEGCSYLRASRLVERLKSAGIAKEHRLPGGQHNEKMCHVRSKGIYRALGVEDIRHRRAATPEVVFRRLLSLDYVLEDPDLPWKASEQEKVRYFSKLGIGPERLPHRTYRGAVTETRRFFALKLPIAGDGQHTTFVYADGGLRSAFQLRRWGKMHGRLWQDLRGAGITVRVVAVGRTVTEKERATRVLQTWATAFEPENGGLSREEEERVARMEKALVTNDEAGLREWGGFMPTARAMAALQRRARAASKSVAALIDDYGTYLSSRVPGDALAASAARG